MYSDNRGVPCEEWSGCGRYGQVGYAPRLGYGLRALYRSVRGRSGIRSWIFGDGNIGVLAGERVRGAGEAQPERRKMMEFMIGENWGLYWDMLRLP